MAVFNFYYNEMRILMILSSDGSNNIHKWAGTDGKLKN